MAVTVEILRIDLRINIDQVDELICFVVIASHTRIGIKLKLKLKLNICLLSFLGDHL